MRDADPRSSTSRTTRRPRSSSRASPWTWTSSPARSRSARPSQVARNAAAQRGGAAGARRREPRARFRGDRRPRARRRANTRSTAMHLTIADVPDVVHARDRGALRPVEEHALEGFYASARRPVHAMRGGGLPAHHLLPRPPRRDGDATRSRCCARQGELPAACSPTATSCVGRSRGLVQRRPTAATGRGGKIRSRSPATSSRWSPRSLDLLEDHFTTRSGKKALLQIYVEPGKLDQAGFAMHALKKCDAAGTRTSSASSSTSSAS